MEPLVCPMPPSVFIAFIVVAVAVIVLAGVILSLSWQIERWRDQ